MKRAMPPAFFVLAVAAFFLPFVSVSCNTDALQGFGEGLAEGLGGEAGSQIPQGDVELLSATGWQLVTNDAKVNEDIPSSETTQTPDPSSAGDVQPFAIAAFGLGVLGIFLSLLRRKTGPILAIALGLLGAVALFLLKQKFAGEGGQAVALAGLDISWKYGYWGSLVLMVAAAATGIVALVTDRAPGAVAVPAEGGWPSAPPPAAPPPSPPVGDPPPPPPAAPPSA